MDFSWLFVFVPILVGATFGYHAVVRWTAPDSQLWRRPAARVGCSAAFRSAPRSPSTSTRATRTGSCSAAMGRARIHIAFLLIGTLFSGIGAVVLWTTLIG
ncbi:hypothetical protein [Saccharopolyspora sp. NPDC002376]